MIYNFIKFIEYLFNVINKYCIDNEEEIDFIDKNNYNKKENLFYNDDNDNDNYFLGEL